MFSKLTQQQIEKRIEDLESLEHHYPREVAGKALWNAIDLTKDTWPDGWRAVKAAHTAVATLFDVWAHPAYRDRLRALCIEFLKKERS